MYGPMSKLVAPGLLGVIMIKPGATFAALLMVTYTVGAWMSGLCYAYLGKLTIHSNVSIRRGEAYREKVEKRDILSCTQAHHRAGEQQ